MKASDLAELVRIETGERDGLTKKRLTAIVEHLLAVVRDETWRAGRVAIPGFGVFRVKRRKARRIKAPDGSLASIPEHDVVCFRPSQNWRLR